MTFKTFLRKSDDDLYSRKAFLRKYYDDLYSRNFFWIPKGSVQKQTVKF